MNEADVRIHYVSDVSVQHSDRDMINTPQMQPSSLIRFSLQNFNRLSSYLIDRNNVFDIIVEAKINHVENSMTSQSCCKSFVETLESQTFRLNDVSCVAHSGWLLQERGAKPEKIIFGNVR